MKLPDKLYDILKWLCLVVLPALATFYNVVAKIWNFPCADEVSQTVLAICALIGAIIGVSTAQYNKGGYAG